MRAEIFVSYLLFLDESGVDRRDSPYEVLAGVAVHDRQLWELICQIQEAETEHFGRRITPGTLELKAKKLLKSKTFRMAAQLPEMEPEERRELARSCLEKGAAAVSAAVTRRELTALAQAKVAFVENVLSLCACHGVRAFASIVPRTAPRPSGAFLRKDYAYLFERFFYFLEDGNHGELGLVIFDELERSQCHLLTDQMGLYFRGTVTGRLRASRVIPEPFFVHSELTTAVQIADLIAYVICWGVRFGSMVEPRREELQRIGEIACSLRYRTRRGVLEQPDHPIWSFCLIEDLRPREEKTGAGKEKGNASYPAKPPLVIVG
jgi:hypothetical protein